MKLPASIKGHQSLLKDLEIRAGRRAIDFHPAFKVLKARSCCGALGDGFSSLMV